MAGISTTNPISYQIVKAFLIAKGAGTPTSLNSCFALATGTFHSTYVGSKDRLTNFKGYVHNAATYFDITSIFVFDQNLQTNETQTVRIYVTNTGGAGSQTINCEWKVGGSVQWTDTHALTLGAGASGDFLEYQQMTSTGLWELKAISDNEFLRSAGWDVEPPVCLVLGTKITLANGEKILIEDLKLGDVLLSEKADELTITDDIWDLHHWESETYNPIKTTAKVLFIERHQPERTVIINDGLLEGTGHHSQIIKRDGIWRVVPLAFVFENDYLLMEDGTLIQVYHTTDNVNPKEVVKLTLEDPHTFYANDILTHNRK